MDTHWGWLISRQVGMDFFQWFKEYFRGFVKNVQKTLLFRSYAGLPLFCPRLTLTSGLANNMIFSCNTENTEHRRHLKRFWSHSLQFHHAAFNFFKLLTLMNFALENCQPVCQNRSRSIVVDCKFRILHVLEAGWSYLDFRKMHLLFQKSPPERQICTTFPVLQFLKEESVNKRKGPLSLFPFYISFFMKTLEERVINLRICHFGLFGLRDLCKKFFCAWQN